MQIAGLDCLLQRVHGPGRLVRAEDRTAPAAGAHRLDAAFAHLMDCCVVIHATVPCRWMTPTRVRPTPDAPGHEDRNSTGWSRFEACAWPVTSYGLDSTMLVSMPPDRRRRTLGSRRGDCL